MVKVSWKMLVLEAWKITFGESLVENARFGTFLVKVSWNLEASLVVSTKSVLTRVCSKRVPRKSVEQECPPRVSSRSVL